MSLAAAVLLAAVVAAVPPETPCKGPVVNAFERVEDDGAADALHYDLDLRIDPGLERIDGTVTVRLALADPGTGTVALDLVDDLTVTGVTWDGTPATFTHADDHLDIDRPAAAPSASVVEIAVAYGGNPPRHGELNMGLVFRDRGPSPSQPVGPSVFNISEPTSSHAWWPCRDLPSDEATATIALTVPDTLNAVANGLRVSDAPADAGWRRTVWETSYPLPPYLVGISVSEFEEWDEDCATAAGPLPLTYHVFPEDVDAAVPFYAGTCDMVRFLEGIAGPYPFPDERYGQMEIKWGGAMEHQTSTSMGNSRINDPASFAQVVVHELAHQWFGDLVSPATWNDIWLNEGFARYCEALWVEHLEGREAYMAYMHAIGHDRHPDLFTGDDPLTAPSPVLQILVYNKGAWVLHMLRDELGDALFFDVLRAWTSEPAVTEGSAASDDFVALASRVAGRDLADWFDPWLTTSVAPDLAWSWRSVPASDGGARIHLEVTQQQDPPFELTVPVALVADGERWPASVRLQGTVTRVVLDVPLPVDDVLLDPDRMVIAATAPLPPPAVTITGPFPSPAGPGGAEIAFRLRAGAETSVALYDARGRRLGSWDLGWRDGDALHPWVWRGEDDRGRPVAGGSYWLEVTAGRDRAVRKVVLVR